MTSPRIALKAKRGLALLLATLLLFTQTAYAGSYTNFIHTDVLGNIVAVTDEYGNIISREHVTPFGSSLGKTNPEDTLPVGEAEHRIGYTGHVRDKDLGLTYMQARYYDPVIGRFMGVDPVGFLENEDPYYFNRYAYANNNPVRYNDPTGMSTGTTGADELPNAEYNAPDPGSVVNDTFNHASAANNNNTNYQGIAFTNGANSANYLEAIVVGIIGWRGIGSSSWSQVPKSAGKYLNNSWYKGTFPNKTQSLKYHLGKHGRGRTATEYTRDAMNFFEKNSHLGKKVTLKDGTPGIKIQTKTNVDGKTQRMGGYWTQDGKLVTFWD